MANGFIQVRSPSSLEVLGGLVEPLVEKWKVSQSLLEFSRSGLVSNSANGGPPKWIPFGQKKLPKADPSDKNFKALKTKEPEERENAEFDSQRSEAISEASKGEQKKFGQGSKVILDSKTKREQERQRREKSDSAEKPVEDIEELGDEGRGGRGGGRGRRGDRDGEEEEGGQAAPSKPVSLFDFLEGQIPHKPAGKVDSQAQARQEKPRQQSFPESFPMPGAGGGRGERRPGQEGGSRGGQDRPVGRGGREGGGMRGSKREGEKVREGEKGRDRGRGKGGGGSSEARRDYQGVKKEEKKKGDGGGRGEGGGRGVDRRGEGGRGAPQFHGKPQGGAEDRLDKYERSLFGEEIGHHNKLEREKAELQQRHTARSGPRPGPAPTPGPRPGPASAPGPRSGTGPVPGPRSVTVSAPGPRNQNQNHGNGPGLGSRQLNQNYNQVPVYKHSTAGNLNHAQRSQNHAPATQNGGSHSNGHAFINDRDFGQWESGLGELSNGLSKLGLGAGRGEGRHGERRGRGGGGAGRPAPAWQEGAGCLAKYWEVGPAVRCTVK